VSEVYQPIDNALRFRYIILHQKKIPFIWRLTKQL